jgi:hypothetical protein
MVAQFSRKDFLEALFGEYYKEYRGFILVRTFKRSDQRVNNRFFPNIEILAKEIYGEEGDVCFGVCPREKMRTDKSYVRFLVALWADLDIGPEGHEGKKTFFEGPQQAAKAIRSFPKPPSIIVESGRGAHLYWLLKEVHEIDDVDRIEGIIQKIADYLQCDTDVSLDAVLRLPETVNTKVPGKLTPCDVKFINPNFRYSLSDFEDLSRRPAPPPARAPQAPKPQPPGRSAQPAPPPQPQPPASAEEVEAELPLLDESVVVDENIIDELIDDMSMTNAVSRAALTEGDEDVEAYVEPPTFHAPLSAPQRREAQPSPTSSVIRTVSETTAAVTSSVLARLAGSGNPVQIQLIGGAPVISGVISWSEAGLLGVESGDDLYTIPLSSVAFIKSKAV